MAYKQGIAVLCAASALALASTPAFALQRGQLAQGIPFVTGGVGQDELLSLHAERGRYNLWVSTVARGTGAYLADAELTITRLDPPGNVMQQTMDGPWFFASLPPGHYRLSARIVDDNRGTPTTLESDVHIAGGGQRQVVLRFPVAVDVGPERERLFDGNPFGAQRTAGGAP